VAVPAPAVMQIHATPLMVLIHQEPGWYPCVLSLFAVGSDVAAGLLSMTCIGVLRSPTERTPLTMRGAIAMVLPRFGRDMVSFLSDGVRRAQPELLP
jgi:hypothetical protein